MPSDRNQAIERMLRQSRAAEPSGGGRDCLDAETLAAWVDGGLSPGALQAVEAHASACARCQAMAATLMSAPLEVAGAEASPARRWVGWLVPLAAGVAAVGLWFAIPQQQQLPMSAPRPAERPQAEPQMAAAPTEPAATSADRFQQSPAPAAPAPARAAQAVPPPAAQPKAESEAAKALRANEARRDELFAGAKPAEEQRQREVERAQAGVAGRLEAAPPPAPSAVADAAAPAPPAAKAPAFAPVAPAPVAGARPGITVGSAAYSRAGAQPLAESVVVGSLVASPNPSIRWRIGAAGSVEFSSNGGASWQAQATGMTTDLTAGSAPTASVCWIVGRGGSVIRTADSGRTWIRVAFPQAVDLVAVEAISVSTASVTAAGGRVFRTVDAGRTWQ